MPTEFRPGDRVRWSISPSGHYIFMEHRDANTAEIRLDNGTYSIFGSSSFLVFIDKLSLDEIGPNVDNEFEEYVFDSDDN